MAAVHFSKTPHLPPDQIGAYRIVRALTAGKSFLAVGEGGRNVVVKMLDAACLVREQQLQLHPAVRDRLARVRELAMPGIANLLSVERDDAQAYIIWDYIEGQSLEEWLATDPPLRQRRLAAREIVLTLESLHAAGIVHGAIHARNIVVDPHNRWWLTHVSPLLITEVGDDIESVEAVLRDMRLEADLPGAAASLRQIRLPLAGLIDQRDEPPSPMSRDDRHDQRVRRRTLLLATAISILAAVLSYAIVVWTR